MIGKGAAKEGWEKTHLEQDRDQTLQSAVGWDERLGNLRGLVETHAEENHSQVWT